MEQKTIVYANTIDWDFHGLTQRPHHILKRLSEIGYKVYYINQTQRHDKVRDRISENFEVYHNWEVFLKRHLKCDIYISSWANRYVDLQRIEADLVIYDSLDSFPDHEHNELNMINSSDIVLTTSQPLYDLRKEQHNNVHLCKNACFYEQGEKSYPVPQDLLSFKSNGKPIVLFAGALAKSWCDIELVEKIAKNYNMVVVGHPWGVRIPKNVHYLGAKTHEELQAYYAHCDVNILPFKRCQIADYSSPIKLFEAMSHGKISVATDIPEAVCYSDVILTSKNHKEFLQNIDKAVNMNRTMEYRGRVKVVAINNTWYQRVDLIDKLIKEHYKNKS